MASFLADLALRRPWWVVAGFVLITVVSVLGTLRLRSVSYLEGHLPVDDPEVLRFQQMQDEFGSDRLFIAALSCESGRRCKDVLAVEMLEFLQQATQAAERAPGTVEVVSLANAGVLVGGGHAIRLERIAPSDSPESHSRFRRLVLGDPILPGTLVSRDLQTTAIVVRFDVAMSDSDRNASVLSLMAELRHMAETPGFLFHASGDTVFGAVTDRYVVGDLSVLTPIMLLLILGLLAWVFRSRSATLLALGTVSLPALWTFGLMGLLGRPLTPVATTLPVLILVVGVTDAIHFLVRTHDLCRAIPDRRTLVSEVVREVGPPTSVTAVTGSLGFLSFLAGPLPALRDFGVFAAVGIVGAWFATFTAIPIALAIWPIRLSVDRSPAFALGDRVLTAVHKLAHRRAVWLGAVSIAVGASSVLGTMRVATETDGFALLGERDPMAISDVFIRDRLRGSGSLELVFRPHESGGLLEPSSLAALSQSEVLILSNPGFGPAISLLPMLRVANREISGTEALPTSRAETAQLLLLIEAADVEGLRRVVTPDYGAARMSVGSRLGSVREVTEIVTELEGTLGPLLAPYGQWHLTGGFLLSLHQAELVLQSQIGSFSAAFLTIFMVLLWFTQSFWLSALGMIPNLLPVAAVLGAMGFAGINLDVGTAMIASIVLGVSVDDTVYFLLHYQRARRGGATVRDSTAFTLAVAGKPALFSAAVLTLGFFVLGFSSFQSLAIFGVLSGVAIVGAAVTEVVILPALLELLAVRRGNAESGRGSASRVKRTVLPAPSRGGVLDNER